MISMLRMGASSSRGAMNSELLSEGDLKKSLRARPGADRRDQFSGAFQFAGGKEICQKLGDGEVNSTGIRKPSALSRGARVTREATFSFVRPFTTSIVVSASSVRGHTTIAP